MILKIINLVLLIVVLISGVSLVKVRYLTREKYNQWAKLRAQEISLNKEYTKLELEIGAYSSHFRLLEYAKNNLGLIPIDKAHTRELK